MCFALFSLVVAVLGSPARDVDVVELLAVHLPESQNPGMYKDGIDEGHVM